MRVLLFLTLLLLGSIASAQEGSGPLFNEPAFKHTLEQLKKEKGARAVLAAAWVGDSPIAQVALGESMTGVPATTTMTFRIGGVSQLFLGTALMRLVEKGEVSLDDTIEKWLPDLPHAEKVTIGMLATNTAGYKDFVLQDEFAEQVLADPFRTFTPDELIGFAVADGNMNFEPGTQQRYSHTQFVILSKALEAATGRSMKEIYESEVLEPLELTGTGYSNTPELPAPVLHAFTSDREVYEDSTFWNPSWAGESGPLYSNLQDLARWGPAFGKGELLEPSSFQQLTERPEAAPPTGPYFATCFVVSNGWQFQTPNFNGYSGVFGYLPEKDLTLMVFATQPEASVSTHPAKEIFKALVTELLPQYPLGL